MRYGSLFAGIGGIDLGLERAGMECAWQVENDPYCIKVLEKHWPNTRRYEDVREIHGLVAHPNSKRPQPITRKKVSGGQDTTASHPQPGGGSRAGQAVCTAGAGAECPDCLPPVDLLAGGFPCQPHSVAGKRRGAEDDRNLWPEYLRLIRETRPRYIIAENVPGIVSTYIDTVLSDLEGEAYTCWTFNLPACAFDAPHRRERIFIVGYAEHAGLDAAEITRSIAPRSHNGASGQEQAGQSARSGEQLPLVAHTEGGDGGGGVRGLAQPDGRLLRPQEQHQDETGQPCCGGEDVAHAESFGVEGHRAGGEQEPLAHGQTRLPVRESKRRKSTHWTTEPDVGRVAHGVPRRIHRLRGLGNAVVPQVAEWIGERIMEHSTVEVIE